ncbi:hypothetical protein UFOVP116_28 [uncultured Caudovirales phage]|uniref:Tail tube protein n=1 Tax=uncultured Caudovirales phage TaxID=2100421 RepID=A0A6J5L7Q8_9CAUD|nr:hypothetical protein UFOVP116_28 [uncultured Caudovirales phage]
MAVSSLTKFTVPLGGGQSASAQGLLMPKLKYRFRVTFENFGVSTPRTELTKQVVDFQRPSVSFGDVTLEVYNSRVRLPGKPSWEDITVNLRDDASGNVAKLVGEQLQKQFDFSEQASASSGIDFKFVTRCEILDGGNGASEAVVLETWELYGCYVTSANYGDLAYSSSDPVQIALTLRFDNAIQTPGGTGVGTAVARTLGTTTTG